MPFGWFGAQVIIVTSWPACTQRLAFSKVREAGALTSGGK